MATAPDVFTKSCTYNTTEPCLRMQTRGQFLRLTGLPTNWKKARLGAILSITAPSGDNVTPVADSLSPASGTHNQWLWGLSDGTGFPGDAAGGKFVGMRTPPPAGGIPLAVAYESSKWRIKSQDGGTSLYCAPVWSSNSTVQGAYGSTQISVPYPTMTDPTAVANYCFGLMIELDVATPGVLNLGTAIANDLSRADAAQMSAVLGLANIGVTPTDGTSGWWSSSGAVACQYFFMRWPLSLNSMRVHNYDAIQLA